MGPAQYLELIRKASDAVEIPIIVVKNGPGATVLLTGGVHGDEYEGVRTILELTREIDPAAMSGDLLCAPVQSQRSRGRGRTGGTGRSWVMA